MCMVAEISSLSVTFFIKFNLVHWWNTSINVALFHPRQFSHYKATQFPFILKLIIKYDWNKIRALNFQLVKYSCTFQHSLFTLAYRGIIERRMHNILNYSPHLFTTPSFIDRYNRERFISNFNWTKTISCYDNKKFTRRNIWHIKTS